MKKKWLCTVLGDPETALKAARDRGLSAEVFEVSPEEGETDLIVSGENDVVNAWSSERISFIRSHNPPGSLLVVIPLMKKHDKWLHRMRRINKKG